MVAVVSSNSSKKRIRFRRSRPNSPAEFSDDVLLEILIRLSHAKAAILCSAVCKAWLRLISSAEFIHKFKQHDHNNNNNNNHVYSDPSFSQPYTVFVKFERSYDGLFPPSRFECLDSSDDVLFSSRGSRPLFDGPQYLPWDGKHFSVRAATRDFLLVSNMTGYGLFELCLCNPLTRQCLMLPPGSIYAGWLPSKSRRTCPFGLAFHPRTKGYRVAFAHIKSFVGQLKKFEATVFNPDTGCWTYSIFTAPKASFPNYHSCFDDAVASASGILYFLLRMNIAYLRAATIVGLFAIDPFKVDGANQTHRCRLIPMPSGFGQPTKRNVRLAVVRGRLRMSLSLRNNQNGGSLDVKVWELAYSDDDERDDDASASWILVHSFSVAEEVFVVGMHPNDGDTIFVVVRGNNDVCSYHIGQCKYHKIGEIPDMAQGKVKDDLPTYLSVFTLLHSSPHSWPAPPLPAIPTMEFNLVIN